MSDSDTNSDFAYSVIPPLENIPTPSSYVSSSYSPTLASPGYSPTLASSGYSPSPSFSPNFSSSSFSPDVSSSVSSSSSSSLPSTSQTSSKYNLIKDLDDAHKCPICMDVAEEPRQHTTCGRLFCKKCLLQHGKDKPCPMCRVANRQYFPDNKSELNFK